MNQDNKIVSAQGFVLGSLLVANMTSAGMLNAPDGLFKDVNDQFGHEAGDAVLQTSFIGLGGAALFLLQTLVQSFWCLWELCAPRAA